MSNFDPNTAFRAKLVQNRFEFQDHIDGKIGIHNGYDIVLEEQINIDGYDYTDITSVLFGLKTQIENLQESIPTATNLIAGNIRLGNNSTSSSYNALGGTYDKIKVVRLTSSNIRLDIPSVNEVGNILRYSGFVGIRSSRNIPGGSAGGQLSGSYPSPNVVNLTITGQTIGDLLCFNGSAWTRIPAGQDGYILYSNGSGNMPEYKIINNFTPAGPAGGYFSGEYPSLYLNENIIPINRIEGDTRTMIGRSSINSFNNNIKYGNGINYDGYFNNKLYVSSALRRGFEEHFVNQTIDYLSADVLSLGLVESGASTNNAEGSFGVAILATATTASWSCVSTESKIRLISSQIFVCRMYITSNINIVDIGFFDDRTSSTFSNCLLFQIQPNGLAKFIAERNTVLTDPSNGVNILLNSFYTFVIELRDVLNCQGTIYDKDGNIVYQQSISFSNMPQSTIPHHCGVKLRTNINSPSIIYVDYISYYESF